MEKWGNLLANARPGPRFFLPLCSYHSLLSQSLARPTKVVHPRLLSPKAPLTHPLTLPRFSFRRILAQLDRSSHHVPLIL